MSESKESAKAAKKLSKAQVKAAKKGHPPYQTEPTAAGGTPAERSARAAEQQLAIRHRQMWISLVAVAIALATLTFSVSKCESRSSDLPTPNDASDNSADS